NTAWWSPFRPFARQGHLVGTVTGPPSGRPSQGSSLSILTEPPDELRRVTRSPPSARAIRSLFRPHCHRGSDCGCNCLNRPTVLALRNDSEAIRLRVLPGRAKALRIKFPRTTVLVAGFCERLTGHLAVRRKRHSEFGAARCRGSEGLAVEESCLDIARSHRLSREGSARSEKNPYDTQWSCIAPVHSITSSAWAGSVRAHLVLSFERQPKDELTVHRHNGVEVETDMVVDPGHVA